MTLREVLRVLRRRWPVLMVSLVLGLAVSGVVIAVRPPSYTAQLSLYVSWPSAVQSGNIPDAQSSQQRVLSYVKLLGSTTTSGAVINRLGLRDTPDRLASRIEASNPTGSLLLDVSVTDTSAAEAALIANTVGEVFPPLVRALEPPARGGQAAVDLNVVGPAAVPDAPSSLGPALVLTLGAIVGLVVGICAALVVDRFRDTARLLDGLRVDASAVLLGAVRREPGDMVPYAGVISGRTEDYMRLHNALRSAGVGQKHRVVVVTSAEQGEGRTTTVSSLAAAAAASGERVLALDADMRRPALADHFGMARGLGLGEVLTGQIRLDFVIERIAEGGFDALGSGTMQDSPARLLNSQTMHEVIGELRNRYDIILIDTPPLLAVADATCLAPLADVSLLVCNPESTSRQAVRRSVEMLRVSGLPLVGAAATKLRYRGPAFVPWAVAAREDAKPDSDERPVTAAVDDPL